MARSRATGIVHGMRQDWSRTQLLSLEVRGYRSLRDVRMEGLGPFVVLHGPNGSGKSNLLRAARLPLAAAALFAKGDTLHDGELTLAETETRDLLDLRLSDLANGATECVFRIRLSLGSSCANDFRMKPGVQVELGLRIAREGAQLLRLRLFDVVLGGVPVLRTEWEGSTQQRRKTELEREMADYGDVPSVPPRELVEELARFQLHIDLAPRVLRTLLPQLTHSIDAYRHLAHEAAEESAPRGRQQELAELLNSEVGLAQGAEENLADALLRAGLFRSRALPPGTRLRVRAITHQKLKEHQVWLLRSDAPAGDPLRGGFPLAALGTGEQQVVYLASELLLTRPMLLHFSEPEAHLHASMMQPLANYLRELVVPEAEDATPQVDQLWLETHHRLFALDRDFWDVSLVDGWTVVKKRPRREGFVHYFEPGPFLGLLREHLDAGGDPDAPAYVDHELGVRTVRQLVEEFDKNPTGDFVQRFLAASNQAVLDSFAARAEKVASETER